MISLLNHPLLELFLAVKLKKAPPSSSPLHKKPICNETLEASKPLCKTFLALSAA